MEHPKHFIREWRQHRHLSLRRLANRLTNDDGTTVISYASLSRIERGLQPYDQPTLEAIADKLNTDPGSLLMRDPTHDEFLWSIWDKIPETNRQQALAMLKGLAKTGT